MGNEYNRAFIVSWILVCVLGLVIYIIDKDFTFKEYLSIAILAPISSYLIIYIGSFLFELSFKIF